MTSPARHWRRCAAKSAPVSNPDKSGVSATPRSMCGVAARSAPAWERLSQAGPEALVPVLSAMRNADTTACNWLRTALDRIVERELAKGRPLPVDELLAFARDARQPGRARRLALDLVERSRPGTSEQQFPLWLD